jgi:hypothetical protein
LERLAEQFGSAPNIGDGAADPSAE